jgi:hypothetical protein
MAELASITWITYADSLSDENDLPSTEAMERTVGYLARYASRVAISNERLISMENGIVKFYYKDYRECALVYQITHVLSPITLRAPKAG